MRHFCKLKKLKRSLLNFVQQSSIYNHFTTERGYVGLQPEFMCPCDSICKCTFPKVCFNIRHNIDPRSTDPAYST